MQHPVCAAVEDSVEKAERVGGTPPGPLLTGVLQVVQFVDSRGP
jgi:hypothetical protein